MASTFYLSSQVVQGRYLYLTCTQTADVASNTSTIAWTLTVTGGTSTYYTTGPTQVYIGKNLIYNKERAQWYSYRFPAARGSVSGVTTVEHAEDGSAVIPVSITTMIYNGIEQTKTANWTLDPITRFAAIQAAPDFTDEEDPVITYANYAGDLVSSLQLCMSLDGKTEFTPYVGISKDGTEYRFSLTEAQREALRMATPHSNTMAVYFLLRTTIGENTGVNSAAATMHIAKPDPVIAPVVEDSNEATVAVTGDPSVLVAGFSTAWVTVNAAARKHATIASQKITHGTQTLDGDGVFENVGTEPIAVTVTDSRGNTVSWEADNTVVPYFAPNCYIENALPDGEGTMPLTVTGKFYNGPIGNGENTLLVQYRVRSGYGAYGDWVSIGSVTASGNDYTAHTVVTGLDYRLAHTFQVRAIDRIVPEGILSSERVFIAVPVFDWSQRDFRFNVPVEARQLTGLTEPENDTDAACKKYVDEKTTALAEKKISMTLLWENDKLTDEFPSKQIDIDLSGYDLVEVFYAQTTDTPEIMIPWKIPVGKQAEPMYMTNLFSTSNVTRTIARHTSVTADYVSFWSCYMKATNSGSGGSYDNTCMIPYRIYGIKGVGIA